MAKGRPNALALGLFEAADSMVASAPRTDHLVEPAFLGFKDELCELLESHVRDAFAALAKDDDPFA